jgi:hypothetical protein
MQWGFINPSGMNNNIDIAEFEIKAVMIFSGAANRCD